MIIAAVLFDLDGTLLDRDSSLSIFVRDQYNRYPELQTVAEEIFVKRFIELDNHGYVWKDKVYQQLLHEFSIQNMDWALLLNDYIKNFHKHCTGFPNLLKMLTALKEQDIKLALVSDKAIFNRALAKLGVTADKALFVGDHPENDIRASRDAGMKAVWKRNGPVDAIPDADAIVDDLEELINIILHYTTQSP